MVPCSIFISFSMTLFEGSICLTFVALLKDGYHTAVASKHSHTLLSTIYFSSRSKLTISRIYWGFIKKNGQAMTILVLIFFFRKVLYQNYVIDE